MLHMSGAERIVAKGASRRNLGITVPTFRSGYLALRTRSLRGTTRFAYLSNGISRVPGAIPLQWCLRLSRVAPHAVPNGSATFSSEDSPDASDNAAALRAALQLEAHLEAELQRLQVEGSEDDPEGGSGGAPGSGPEPELSTRQLLRESGVLRRKSELLEAMVGALRERLRREEERSTNLAGEVEAGRAQLALSEGARRQLGSTIAHLRTELADTQSQLAQALQLSEDLEQRVLRLSQRNTALALRVGELEEELGRAEEAAAVAAADTRNRIRKLEAAAEQDQAQIVELQSALSAREAQLAALREGEAELQDLLQQSQAAAQQLSATLAAKEEELESMRAAVEDAEAAGRQEAEDLRDQLANLEAVHSEQLTTLRSQLSEAEAEAAAVREELAEAAEAAETQRMEMGTLRKQLHSAQLAAERSSAARVREVIELRSGLEAQLAAARAEAVAARGQLADVSTALQGLLSGQLLGEVEEELRRAATQPRSATPPATGPAATQQGAKRSIPEEKSLASRESSLRAQLSSLAAQLADLQAAAVARLGPALVARAQQLEAAAADARKARAAAVAAGDEAAAQRATISLNSLTSELGALYRLAMSSDARNRERAVQAEMQARELELRGLLEKRAHRAAAAEIQEAAAAAQHQQQGLQQQVPGQKSESSAQGPSPAAVQLQQQLRQAVAVRMRALLREREQQLQQQAAEREAQLRAQLAERLAAGEEAQQREIRAVQQTVEKQVRLLESAWRGQLDAFTRALKEAAEQREALSGQATAAAAQVRSQLSELEVLRSELSAAQGAIAALRRAAEGSREQAAQQSEAAGRQVATLAEQVAKLTKQLQERERQLAAFAAQQAGGAASRASGASTTVGSGSTTFTSLPTPLPPPSPTPPAGNRQQIQDQQQTRIKEAIPKLEPAADTEGPLRASRPPSQLPTSACPGQPLIEPSGVQPDRTPNTNPRPRLNTPQAPKDTLTPLRPGWPLQYGGVPGAPTNTIPPPPTPPVKGAAASSAASPSKLQPNTMPPGKQPTRQFPQSPQLENSSPGMERSDNDEDVEFRSEESVGSSECSIGDSGDGGCGDYSGSTDSGNMGGPFVMSTGNSRSSGSGRAAGADAGVLTVWTRLLMASDVPLPSEMHGNEQTDAEVGSHVDVGVDSNPLAQSGVDEAQQRATSDMQVSDDPWGSRQPQAPAMGPAEASAGCEGRASAAESEEVLVFVFGSEGKPGAGTPVPRSATSVPYNSTQTIWALPALEGAAAAPSPQNTTLDTSRAATSAAVVPAVRQGQPLEGSASTGSDPTPSVGVSPTPSTASADSATTASNPRTLPNTPKFSSRSPPPPSSASHPPPRPVAPVRSAKSPIPSSPSERARASPLSSGAREAPSPASAAAAAGPSPAAAAMAAAAGAAAAAKRAAAAASRVQPTSSSLQSSSSSGASNNAFPERPKGFSAPPISEWGRPTPSSPPPAPNRPSAANAPSSDPISAPSQPPSRPSSGSFFSEAELGAEIAAIAQSLVARTLAEPSGTGAMNPPSPPPPTAASSTPPAAVNTTAPITPSDANTANPTATLTTTSGDKSSKGRGTTEAVLRRTSSPLSPAPSGVEGLAGTATVAPNADNSGSNRGGGGGVGAGGNDGETGRAEESTTRQLTLAVAAAARSVPQVQEAQIEPERGSEDAYFLLTPSGSRYPPRPPGRPAPPGAGSVTALGVADGVGGWAEAAVDPGQYAREVCAAAAQAAEEAGPGLTDPRQLLSAAQASVRTMGSCTACVALLAQGPAAGSSGGGTGSSDAVLCVANLGDSGVRVVRRGGLVLASSPQEHAFNMPYQMAHPDNLADTDTAQQAQMYTIALEPGDIIILATDGLFDNMWDEELVSLAAAAAAGLPAGVYGPAAASASASAASQLAGSLVATASRHAADPGFRSPWAVELANRPSASWLERLFPRGGRADDITVVVAITTVTE